MCDVISPDTLTSLHGSILKVCRDQVSFHRSLRVLGVISLTVDDKEEQEVVLKINNVFTADSDSVPSKSPRTVEIMEYESNLPSTTSPTRRDRKSRSDSGEKLEQLRFSKSPTNEISTRRSNVSSTCVNEFENFTARQVLISGEKERYFHPISMHDSNDCVRSSNENGISSMHGLMEIGNVQADKIDKSNLESDQVLESNSVMHQGELTCRIDINESNVNSDRGSETVIVESDEVVKASSSANDIIFRTDSRKSLSPFCTNSDSSDNCRVDKIEFNPNRIKKEIGDAELDPLRKDSEDVQISKNEMTQQGEIYNSCEISVPKSRGRKQKCPSKLNAVEDNDLSSPANVETTLIRSDDNSFTNPEDFASSKTASLDDSDGCHLRKDTKPMYDEQVKNSIKTSEMELHPRIATVMHLAKDNNMRRDCEEIEQAAVDSVAKLYPHMASALSSVSEVDPDRLSLENRKEMACELMKSDAVEANTASPSDSRDLMPIIPTARHELLSNQVVTKNVVREKNYSPNSDDIYKTSVKSKIVRNVKPELHSGYSLLRTSDFYNQNVQLNGSTRSRHYFHQDDTISAYDFHIIHKGLHVSPLETKRANSFYKSDSCVNTIDSFHPGNAVRLNSYSEQGIQSDNAVKSRKPPLLLKLPNSRSSSPLKNSIHEKMQEWIQYPDAFQTRPSSDDIIKQHEPQNFHPIFDSKTKAKSEGSSPFRCINVATMDNDKIEIPSSSDKLKYPRKPSKANEFVLDSSPAHSRFYNSQESEGNKATHRARKHLFSERKTQINWQPWGEQSCEQDEALNLSCSSFNGYFKATSEPASPQKFKIGNTATEDFRRERHLNENGPVATTFKEDTKSANSFFNYTKCADLVNSELVGLRPIEQSPFNYQINLNGFPSSAYSTAYIPHAFSSPYKTNGYSSFTPPAIGVSVSQAGRGLKSDEPPSGTSAFKLSHFWKKYSNGTTQRTFKSLYSPAKRLVGIDNIAPNKLSSKPKTQRLSYDSTGDGKPTDLTARLKPQRVRNSNRIEGRFLLDAMTQVPAGRKRRKRGTDEALTTHEVVEYMGMTDSAPSRRNSNEESLEIIDKQPEMNERIDRTRFVCRYCDLISSNLTSYLRHTVSQHGAYICHECGKVFTTKSSLLRHRPIHTGVRRFACAICQRTFYRKDKCKAHIRKHLEIDEQGNGISSNRPSTESPINLMEISAASSMVSHDDDDDRIANSPNDRIKDVSIMAGILGEQRQHKVARPVEKIPLKSSVSGFQEDLNAIDHVSSPFRNSRMPEYLQNAVAKREIRPQMNTVDPMFKSEQNGEALDLTNHKFLLNVI